MTNPFISIVMAVYNCEKYIQEAINSILLNEFHNIELIIVDDGSTDSTPEILADISDERVTVLTQENKGVAAARNLGIKHTTGNYITFSDGDDIFFKDSLKFRFESFNKHPDAEAIYAGLPLYCDENLNPTRKKDTLILNKKEQEDINKYPVFALFETKFLQSLQALTIKREALERVGFLDEELKIGEDFEFYIRVLENCKTYLYTDRYDFKYRKNPTSLMNSRANMEKHKQATKLILEKINNYHFPKKRHRIKKRRLCANKFLDHIEAVFSLGEKEEAKKLFFQFLCDPKSSKSFVLKRIIKVILRLNSLI